MDRTFKEIHRGTHNILSTRELNNPNKRKQWMKQQVDSYLNAARRTQSKQPKSLDTAYWEYMKETRNGMRWKKMVDLLNANPIRHKRKRDEEMSWINMVECWIAFKIHLIFY